MEPKRAVTRGSDSNMSGREDFSWCLVSEGFSLTWGAGVGGANGAAQIMAPGVCGKAVPSGQPGSRVRPAPSDLHGTSKLNLLKIL